MVLFALWDKIHNMEMDAAAYISLIPVVNLGVSCGILFIDGMGYLMDKFDQIDFTKSTFFLVKIYRAIRNGMGGRKEQGE